MKHNHRFCLACVFLCLFSTAACADLDSDIRAVLRDKLLSRATVSIQVVQLGADASQSKLLFSSNPQTALMPASNMKLITTSAALDGLGADFSFRTLLVQQGDDLILVGDGDPTFGDAALLRKFNWTTTTVFQNWAQELKKAGRTSVGDIRVDDSVFDTTFVHPHWQADQLLNSYEAQVSGMTINAGCIDFYVRTAGAGKLVSYVTDPPTHYVTVHNTCIGGRSNAIVLDRVPGANAITLKGTTPASSDVPVSITVHDPALYAEMVLAETLYAAGIRVDGKVVRDRGVRAQLQDKAKAGSYKVLAIHETPLLQVISRANKDSMNLYAESLCKRLGYAATGESGSWQNGTAASGAFLIKAGAGAGEFHLDDGCGLSRENRISTQTMLKALEYDFYGKNWDAFKQTLAVGGEDGTLDERFKGPLRGRVLAKTGFIEGVSALSGYLQGRDGRWYAFSILMNGIGHKTNSQVKDLQEAIVKAIDNSARPAR